MHWSAFSQEKDVLSEGLWFSSFHSESFQPSIQVWCLDLRSPLAKFHSNFEKNRKQPATLNTDWLENLHQMHKTMQKLFPRVATGQRMIHIIQLFLFFLKIFALNIYTWPLNACMYFDRSYIISSSTSKRDLKYLLMFWLTSEEQRYWFTYFLKEKENLPITQQNPGEKGSVAKSSSLWSSCLPSSCGAANMNQATSFAQRHGTCLRRFLLPKY